MMAHTHWIKIFETEAALKNNVLPSKPYPLTVKGEKILLIYDQTTFYAVQEKCPHNGASLANGFCIGAELTCPVHRFRFNVVDGKALSGGSYALKTYPVVIQSDGVFVGVKAKWWEA